MVGKVFPTKTDTPKKLVGAYVDEEIAHHLSLLSLIKDESKSVLLNSLLRDYLENQPSIDTLLSMAAARTVAFWDKHGFCNKKTKSAFNDYLEATAKDLKRHRLPNVLIDKIIEEVRKDASN